MDLSQGRRKENGIRLSFCVFERTKELSLESLCTVLLMMYKLMQLWFHQRRLQNKQVNISICVSGAAGAADWSAILPGGAWGGLWPGNYLTSCVQSSPFLIRQLWPGNYFTSCVQSIKSISLKAKCSILPTQTFKAFAHVIFCCLQEFFLIPGN